MCERLSQLLEQLLEQLLTLLINAVVVAVSIDRFLAFGIPFSNAFFGIGSSSLNYFLRFRGRPIYRSTQLPLLKCRTSEVHTSLSPGN